MVRIDFESLFEKQWSESELKNVKIISDFVQNLMNDHKFDYILEKYGKNPYVQHNSMMEDGIPGLVKFAKQTIGLAPEFSYDVKKVIADGDYVMTHAHATMKESDRGDDTKGLIIMDYWRFKNGVLVEHWDSMQPMQSELCQGFLFADPERKNSNGVF